MSLDSEAVARKFKGIEEHYVARSVKEGRRYVELTNLGFGGEHMEGLAEILNRHPSVTDVNLYRNNIEENAGLLAGCAHIRVLRLQNNGIGDADALMLANSGTIQFLDLNETAISERCARELLEKIGENFRVSVAGCRGVSAQLQTEISEKNKLYVRKKEMQPAVSVGSDQDGSILTKFFSKICSSGNSNVPNSAASNHSSVPKGNTSKH